MGKGSAIEWTDHTFNPWWGCVKISPACDNCYAAAFSHRLGRDHWGPHAKYRVFGEKHWGQPIAWDRAAYVQGERRRVFCASMADVFDNAADPELRGMLWNLIRETPNLDWQLLTKRPQNIAAMLPPDWDAGYPNVWLGVTAENQEEADRRIPVLLRTPSRIRFVSYEPALGPIDFRHDTEIGPMTWLKRYDIGSDPCHRIDWVIAGGESGPHSRIPEPHWFRSVRDQCAAAGVAFLFKQWGEWAPHIRNDGLASLPMKRVGKTVAGRLLDGREHSEFPQ
jgi:protein gp37